jgi:hypothetical protein
MGAQIGPINQRFVDKRRGRTQDGVAIAEANNMDTVAELDARCTALSAAYTVGRLAQMTVNDKMYALRLLSADVAGVK